MTAPFPPRRIVVAVDLSGPSLEALAAARKLARRFGAALTAVYVDSPPVRRPKYRYDALDAAAAKAVAAQRTAFRRRWESEMAEVAAAEPGFSSLWLKGWPVATLRKLGRTGKADLLVVGAHGRSGLPRLLYGSTAEALLEASPVPVLCVHEGVPPRPSRGVLVPCFDDSPEAAAAVLLADRAARALGARLTVLRGRRRELFFREAARGWGLIVLPARRRRLSLEGLMGSPAQKLLRQARVPVLAAP